MTRTHSVINPATERVIAETPLAAYVGAADPAIESVHKAFPARRAVDPSERATLLRRLASVVDAHVDELARARGARRLPLGATPARGMQHPRRAQLPFCSAGAHVRPADPRPGGFDLTFHEPLGALVPSNFPMLIGGWGIAVALAAGNCVIIKPTELNPAYRNAHRRAGTGARPTPGRADRDTRAGNVVGERLVMNQPVRRVSFTKLIAVGKKVIAGRTAQVEPRILELGDKSANILFADAADLAQAAATDPYAVFDSVGQDCCARSQVLVQDTTVDEEFLDRLEKSVTAVRATDRMRSPWGRTYSPHRRAGLTPQHMRGGTTVTGRVQDGPRSSPETPQDERVVGPTVRRRGPLTRMLLLGQHLT